MMKKNLAAVALMGLSCGLMIGCQPKGDKTNGDKNGTNGTNGGNGKKPAERNGTSQRMSADEQRYYNQLNQQARNAFRRMDADQREMAMKTAAHDCKSHNECKGLGKCKTAENECAGKNQCKGKGSCKTDANQAVMLVKEKMADKRQAMTK